MSTRISFLIFSSFFFSTLLAQQSINSGGNKANGATGSVNYSVGQVFYHHLNNDNYQIHEGVQYGYEIINSIGENNTIELKYNVYPNPTTSNFTLNISDFNPNTFSYILYDINGKELNHLALTNPKTNISLSKYNSKTFLLNVYNKNKNVKSFTIIKN